MTSTPQKTEMLRDCLKVIAGFEVDENTNRANLLSLVQAMANITLERAA